LRRKLSSKKTILGSVKMKGQRISIRIISTEYMQVQKTYKCRFEVISKSSEYFGNVDILYSKEAINPGHCYSVRLSDDPSNPGIIKVFKEIKTP
jgi:hypothetical protein